MNAHILVQAAQCCFLCLSPPRLTDLLPPNAFHCLRPYHPFSSLPPLPLSRYYSPFISHPPLFLLSLFFLLLRFLPIQFLCPLPFHFNRSYLDTIMLTTSRKLISFFLLACSQVKSFYTFIQTAGLV